MRVNVRVDEKGEDMVLEDGTPLVVNMGGSKQRDFRFQIKQKETVYFNLVGPLNSFVMVVGNSDKRPEEGDVDLPSGGSFVRIEKESVENLTFTVQVKSLSNKEN